MIAREHWAGRIRLEAYNHLPVTVGFHGRARALILPDTEDKRGKSDVSVGMMLY